MPTQFGVIVPQGWRMDLVQIPDPVEKYETMTRAAQEAERLGYHSVWLYDHFHTVPTEQVETTFESWTSTAGLARDTKTIRVGQMVTCNGYRPPALIAKMASTVDVMSHGRLDFGIGAGWYEEEFRAYGFDYPEGPERLRMLDEAMQVIHAMWRDPRATFEGKYYRLAGAINEPKGAQQPHPPIWLGGSGEKVTLKLVAKYADACNISTPDPAVFRQKLGALHEHCDRLGRDYATVLKSDHIFIYLLEPGQTPRQALEEASKVKGYEGLDIEQSLKGNIIGTPQQVAERIQGLVEAGCEYFIIYFRSHLADLQSYRVFAQEVMPLFG
ncbi:MAG: LLM class F420-dependent oxidoreductase [Chloroflexia bacterium]